MAWWRAELVLDTLVLGHLVDIEVDVHRIPESSCWSLDQEVFVQADWLLEERLERLGCPSTGCQARRPGHPGIRGPCLGSWNPT